jgi:hypothetical protein
MYLARLKKILVIMFILFNLFTIEQLWASSMSIANKGSDSLERWETQMKLVKKVLPIKRGVIGYVSEQDMSGVDYGYWDTEAEFFLTQYELAPLILKKGLVAEWDVVVLDNKNLAIWQASLQEDYPFPYEIISIKGKVRVFHRLDNP